MRNASARRQHNRETWLQILLPLLLGAGLLIGVSVLAVSSRGGDPGPLSQVATILLAILMMAIGLIILVILLASIVAVARVMGWLPPTAYRLQQSLNQVRDQIVRGTDQAARPVLAVESWAKAAERTLGRFF